MALSLRKQKKMRAAQRERNAIWRSTPVGPERLRLLVEWAHIGITEMSTRGLIERRQAFNASKDVWRGHAGIGWCGACGREGKRVWHHIVQLQLGGTNSPKNLVKVCWPCHAVIHPHLPMTAEDPITAGSAVPSGSESRA
jgi:5-methylcytosine-specific restriction endonuclease McrA